MTDFFRSLSSHYTIEILDFFYWLSDVGIDLWQSDPDEFVDQCENRSIELLLDMTGCLDAKL